MKISTWNVERLKHKNALNKIINICEQEQSDILVLTETDRQIMPYYKYCFQTQSPINDVNLCYNNTENRVSVFTNYRCVQQHPTYNQYTSVCVEMETPQGLILVYGTIIGIYGNRHLSYMEDLRKQINDISRLIMLGKPLCICGDFNCSFADNYYYTKAGRDTILNFFTENKISILTSGRIECIDHIAISDSFIGNSDILIKEWNYNKVLSDHKGISVQIDFL